MAGHTLRPALSVAYRSIRWLAAAIATWLGVLCAPPLGAATLPPELVIADWPQRSKHPLVGRIWLVREQRLVDAPAIARGVLVGSPIADAIGIRSRTFLLLGEIHDNPDHHLFRAGLIDAVTGPTAFGRTAFPAVVAEHFRAEQAEALEAFRRDAAGTEAATPDLLFERLQWARSGWPDARMFRPLFAAAIDARLPILPGDASRERIRAVARGGIGALDSEEAARLGLRKDLASPLSAALSAEIKGSHCGMLPDTAIPGMSAAQRYRDAHLADAMIAAADKHGGAILLAGNGHIRSDRGVPWYLRERAPGRSVLAVLLVEVEEGRTSPSDYVPLDPAGGPAADVVVFTPRAPREDPCEKMRAHMQKTK